MATKFQQGSATIDISLSGPEQYTLWTQKVTQRLVFEQSLVNPPATYVHWLSHVPNPLPNNPDQAQQDAFALRTKENALVTIFLTGNVSHQIFTEIVHLINAKDIWDYLRQRCLPQQSTNITDIRVELYNTKLSDSAESYLQLIRSKVEILKQLNVQISHDVHLSFILSVLPPSFNSLNTSLNILPANERTIARVETLIRAEESIQKSVPQIKLEANYTSRGKFRRSDSKRNW